MTDYNDGEWHLWNSCHRPDGVHSESLMTYVWHDEQTGKYGIVEGWKMGWVVPWSQVLKFRVTKPHRKPRVIWVNEYQERFSNPFLTEENARRLAGSDATRIAVRYVEAPE